MAVFGTFRPLFQTRKDALKRCFQQNIFYCKKSGPDVEEIANKLQKFAGGSIELQKHKSGIAVMTVNNPSRINAFSGT